MIVELLIGAILVAAGAATARVMVRRRSPFDPRDDVPDPSSDADGDEDPETDPAEEAAKRGRKPTPLRPSPRGLRVGDVLLYADTELWLAGKLELDEEGWVARLFVTPGSRRGTWLAQLDPEGREVATLAATDEVPAGAVPEALPIGGRRLRLARRGDCTVRSEGEHLPAVDRRARYTFLSDTGGRVLVVLDFEGTAPRLALVGDLIPAHLLELLPGGDLDAT